MKRKDFLKTLALMPLAGVAMKLNDLHKLAATFAATEPMPVLFVGHGNPMNAITDNEYSRTWRQIGKSLPRPNAILCISAHWETKGTFLTAVEKPETIHDFGGFPQALFDLQYPAPGSPELAKDAQMLLKKTAAGLDYEWGLDHGCWSVLVHLFPQADVPVVQMSLDYGKPASWHYELAQELSALRRKGVLIVGSGNIVHNLRMLDWSGKGGGYDWAVQANDKVKSLVTSGDYQPLLDYKSMGREMQLAVPTPEHYLPLLYSLGLKEEKDRISFFNDKTEMGSLSMTSLKIEQA